MSENAPNPDVLQAALDALLSMRSPDLGVQQLVNEAATALMRLVRQATPQAPTIKAPSPEPSKADKVFNSPFRSMGLREAVVRQLEINCGPQFPQEVWAALDAAGFEIAHNDPVHAVASAFKRRAKEKGDVTRLSDGRWALTGWTKPVNGVGRDPVAHSKKTRIGLETAKRRGVRLGGKLKLTQDLVDRLRELRDAGYSIDAACRLTGISRTSFQNHKAEIEKDGIAFQNFRGLRNSVIDEQSDKIIDLLDAGASVDEACRRVGVDAVFYHNFVIPVRGKRLLKKAESSPTAETTKH